MNFNSFKLKYQRYAIPNLAFYSTMVYIAGYLLLSGGFGNSLYYQVLAFYPAQVLRGQIWRLFTPMLFPPVAGQRLLIAAVGLYIYYNFAISVQRGLGDFEFNLYFFGSYLIGEIIVLLYYLISKENLPFLPVYTQFSVFMVFALLYPDTRVYLYFLFPIKTIYIAALEVAIYLFQFIRGSAFTRVTIIAAVVPVILFAYILRYRTGQRGIFQSIRDSLQQKKRQKDWRDRYGS